MSELVPLGAAGTVIYLGRKVLGPTIDQFAIDLKTIYTEWRAANFEKILKKIKRRAGDTPEGTGVHPRVARTLLDEGSWIDDDVQQEYIAGLLLTSRSERGADDSGSYYARIAANLTSSQTRLHYAVYSALAQRIAGGPHEGMDTPLGKSEGYTVLVHTSLEDALRVVNPCLGDQIDLDQEVPLLVDAAIALHREGLTDGHRVDGINGGFSASPTSLGALLYMRARGFRAIASDFIHYAGIPLQDFDPEPPTFPNARIGLAED